MSARCVDLSADKREAIDMAIFEHEAHRHHVGCTGLDNACETTHLTGRQQGSAFMLLYFADDQHSLQLS